MIKRIGVDLESQGDDFREGEELIREDEQQQEADDASDN